MWRERKEKNNDWKLHTNETLYKRECFFFFQIPTSHLSLIPLYGVKSWLSDWKRAILVCPLTTEVSLETK